MIIRDIAPTNVQDMLPAKIFLKLGNRFSHIPSTLALLFVTQVGGFCVYSNCEILERVSEVCRDALKSILLKLTHLPYLNSIVL